MKKKLLGSLLCVILCICFIFALTACNDPQKWTITYDTKGGSEMNSTIVENGSTLSKPANPTKIGYTFKGWCLEGGGTTPITFPLSVTKNTILYAIWEVQEYNVSLNTNQIGGGTVRGGGLYEYGTQVTVTAVTFLGFIFQGWFNGDEYLSNNAEYMFTITSPINLEARWSVSSEMSDFIFTSTETTCEITKYTGSGGEILIPDYITRIKYELFSNNNAISSISIGNNITKIEHDTFRNCINLKSVIIGNSVKSIGEDAFYGCDNITNLTIGSSVKTIDDFAFLGCEKLTNVIIPDSVTDIGLGAFSSCAELRTISMGSSVINIGGDAFSACDKLEGVYITDLASWCKINFLNTVSANPLSYAKNLYLNNVLIDNLIIPEGVTIVRAAVFYNCGLTSIVMPNTLKMIEGSAFAGCKGLTEIYIPIGVETISYGIFSNCSNLQKIYCAAVLKPIGWNQGWRGGSFDVVWGYTD